MQWFIITITVTIIKTFQVLKNKKQKRASPFACPGGGLQRVKRPRRMHHWVANSLRPSRDNKWPLAGLFLRLTAGRLRSLTWRSVSIHVPPLCTEYDRVRIQRYLQVHTQATGLKNHGVRRTIASAPGTALSSGCWRFSDWRAGRKQQNHINNI